MGKRITEAEVVRKLDQITALVNTGLDCLYPARPNCCPCKHEGSDYIMIDGKPAACSCGKCPRWQCLGCNKTGKTDLCMAATDLAFMDM
jgi:hypothetical protein